MSGCAKRAPDRRLKGSRSSENLAATSRGSLAHGMVLEKAGIRFIAKNVGSGRPVLMRDVDWMVVPSNRG